jgi:2,3-bisphosphoglycerate-independent phosphoglycerate mutase
MEASDEAGHEGDPLLKIRTIEDMDSRVVGPIYEAVKTWAEPVAIAVLPDHPTPCEIRTHTADPVPFLIYKPGEVPDDVEIYDEFSVLRGGYGLLRGDEFLPKLIS